MATMQIHFRDDLKERLAARAIENGFDSVEAYVESLLLADVGDEQTIDDDLEQLLLKRLESGPGIEFTPAFVEQFKRQVAERRGANGKRP